MLQADSASTWERQLGWASCLASAGKVSLASGTAFLHINTLARLTVTGITLGVASVTRCLGLGFKVEIRIKEVKIDSTNPTLIEGPRETQTEKEG